jgi:hypothetical protein
MYQTCELASLRVIDASAPSGGPNGGGVRVTTEQESRGGLLGFLTTLPGILTAIAALITAGTGAVVYLANGDDSAPDKTRLVIETQAAPAAPTDAEAAAVKVSADTGLSSDDPAQAMIDDCASGDTDACAWVLETLAQECYDGYGLSCDALYAMSPAGSDYEWYGGTCGEYFADLTHAGTCSTL